MKIGIVGAGMVHLAIEPDRSIVVFMGAAMLIFSLGIFMAGMGIICDLIYQTANLKVEKILKVDVA